MAVNFIKVKAARMFLREWRNTGEGYLTAEIRQEGTAKFEHELREQALDRAPWSIRRDNFLSPHWEPGFRPGEVVNLSTVRK